MIRGKVKVLVGGCFDILHYGHIYFLKKAKAFGDYLIVALESDKGVRKLKGRNRPIHNQKQRKEALESLRFVDKVLLLPEMKSYKDYEAVVLNIKPQVMAITEGDPKLKYKEYQAKKVGATLIKIPLIKELSTSKIAKILDIEG